MCINEVRKINGVIECEDAVRYQKEKTCYFERAKLKNEATKINKSTEKADKSKAKEQYIA